MLFTLSQKFAMHLGYDRNPITKNFQKSPNLVTLASRTYLSVPDGEMHIIGCRPRRSDATASLKIIVPMSTILQKQICRHLFRSREVVLFSITFIKLFCPVWGSNLKANHTLSSILLI